MKEENVVFVIGAGASKEFNLPLGVELLDEIERVTKCYRSDRIQDDLIHYATNYLKEVDQELYNKRSLVNAAMKINKAIPLVISIDNYIDNHNGDKCVEAVAKLAIAKCILDAERKSNLFNDSSDGLRIDFSKSKKTWLNKLFKILTQNCTYEQLKDRFSKISFIIFNYDRCIEHYFFNALQTAYHISHEQASDVISQLKIYHTYGQVGELLYTNNNGQKVDYGLDIKSLKLKNIALDLKTFTEGIDPEDSHIEKIRSITADAYKVFFLGFGYHNLNLELLIPRVNSLVNNKKLYGTAYGISTPNVEAIEKDLCHKFRVEPKNIILRTDLTCTGFIDEFSRYI